MLKESIFSRCLSQQMAKSAFFLIMRLLRRTYVADAVNTLRMEPLVNREQDMAYRRCFDSFIESFFQQGD